MAVENNNQSNYYIDIPKINIRYLVQEQIKQCQFTFLKVNPLGGSLDDEIAYIQAVDGLYDLLNDFIDKKLKAQMVYLNKLLNKKIDEVSPEKKKQEYYTTKVKIARQKFQSLMRLLRRLNWL